MINSKALGSDGAADDGTCFEELDKLATVLHDAVPVVRPLVYLVSIECLQTYSVSFLAHAPTISKATYTIE